MSSLKVILHLSFYPKSESTFCHLEATEKATIKPKPETNSKEKSMSSRIEALTIEEDVKEGEAEDDEGLPIFPYDRLKTTSQEPVAEIDVTKREVNI